MLIFIFYIQVRMLPETFKSMFGIKDQKDLKMANNIWKMLDQMSSNDPQSYQKFIQKNLKEGFNDAKVEKQKKQKPFKLIPNQYMVIQMDGELQEQYLGKEGNEQFKQKLDVNINKQKWSDVRNKFANKIRIYLNICHTDRIKNPTSKQKNGQQIKQFNITMLKDIQNLYYSLQGPIFDEDNQNTKQLHNCYFCIIFNSNFLTSFQTILNGNRILLGLSVAYFQERLKTDRNPILIKVNTHSLYGKNLYYGIQKSSLQVNQTKKFKYGKHQKVCQFLLEKQIDIKQIEQKKKQKNQKKPSAQKIGQKIVQSNKIKPVQNQILIRPKQQQSSSLSQLPPLIPSKEPQKKKVLIQVLEQKQFKDPREDTQIPYQMRQSQEGYVIEFLVHGIEKISQLDLEVSSDTIKLKTLKEISGGNEKSVIIKLGKKIDENSVRAKMKKKTQQLQVSLNFNK